MSVQIDKILNLVSLKYQVWDHFFDCGYNWIKWMIGIFCPFAIHIRTRYIASGVTVYNTIYVGHWNYLENVLFEKLYCCFSTVYVNQIINESLKYKWRNNFTGMLSSYHNYDFLFWLYLLSLTVTFPSYGQKRTLIAGNSWG